jgi:hypothetical protein
MEHLFCSLQFLRTFEGFLVAAAVFLGTLGAGLRVRVTLKPCFAA